MHTLTTTGSEQDIRDLSARLLGNAGAGDEPLRAFLQLFLSARRFSAYLDDCMGPDDDEPVDIDVHAVAEAARQHRTFVDEFVRLHTPA